VLYNEVANENPVGGDKLKKSISTKLIITIYSLFIVGTIITAFIVYKDIDHPFTYRFLIGYVIFMLLLFCYFIILAVMNIGKLKWHELRKRLVKFVGYFILLSALNYVISYGFKSAEISYYKLLSVPLGLSLGWAFFDIIFLRKRDRLK